MTLDSNDDHPTSLRSRIFYIFKLWSCFLALVYLPLDLIFRLDSFLLSRPASYVVVSTFTLLILMVLLSAMIAITYLPWLVMAECVPKAFRPHRDNGKLTHFLLLFLSCMLFAKLFKLWLVKIGYPVAIRAIYIGLLFFLAVYWANRRVLHLRIRHFVLLLSRYLPLLCAISFAITLGRATLESAKPAKLPRLDSAAKTGTPNVILITFDALSAEDMSLYGYHLNTTPNIDAFAKECYVFDNVVATSNWTRPTAASLMTGKYPDRHRLINIGSHDNVIDMPHESLPGYLRRKGLRTSAVIANGGYAHPYAIGLADQFDHKPFLAPDPRRLPYFNPLHLLHPKYSYIVEHHFQNGAVLWLGEILSELVGQLDNFCRHTITIFPPEIVFRYGERYLSTYRDKPMFLWLHSFAPHAAYLPPPPQKGTFLPGDELTDNVTQGAVLGTYPQSKQRTVDRLRLRYDEHIRYADYALGNYLDFLRNTGRMEDSIIIISADHGESFGGGYQGHGGPLLTQPLVHIPLLIHLPGQSNGKRIKDTASQVDIAPTIVDLLQGDVPGWMEGKSLKGAIVGGKVPALPVFCMNLDGNRSYGRMTKGSVAVLLEGYKYVHDMGGGPGRLYDLTSDKAETVDVQDKERVRANAMRKLVLERFEAATKLVNAAPPLSSIP